MQNGDGRTDRGLPPKMPLGYKTLRVGQLLLGVVKTVSDRDVVVSLPSFLTAYAPKNDKHHDTCLPGQWVQCVITSLGRADDPKRKRIEVSFSPQDVNGGLSDDDFMSSQVVMATVSSHEDKGMVLDFGGSGSVVGFCQGSFDYSIGRILMVATVPRQSSTSRSVDATVVSCLNAMAPVSTSLSPRSIRPGLRVAAKIEGGSSDAASFCGEYTAQLDTLRRAADVSSAYVISADPLSNIYRLSGDLCMDVDAKANLAVLGAHIRDAAVVSVDSNHGMVLNSGDVFCYVHISRVSDDKIQKITLKKGDVLDARIIEWDPFTGLYLASAKPSLMSKNIIRVEQLKVGMLVKGTVVRLETFGIVVEISEHLRGLCPTSHLTETQASGAFDHIKAGQKMSFRVWEVDLLKKSCILTRKKGLLAEDVLILSSYSAAKKGTICHGFIAAIQTYGLLIKFFNGIKGLIHISELKAFPDLDASFFSGQVVRCQVIACNPDTKSLKLRLFEGELAETAKLPRPEPSGTLSPPPALAVPPIVTDIVPQCQNNSLVKMPSLKSIEMSAVPAVNGPVDEMREPRLNSQQVISQFEKRLIGEANNAEAWIQYVASLADLSEFKLVRETYERAIRSLDQRNEQGRSNLWISYLNFESAFGSSQTLRAVFEKAALFNDPLTIHLVYAKIHDAAGRSEDALGAYHAALKKFRTSCKLWTAFIGFHFKHKSFQAAKRVFNEALKALPSDKHLKIKCKYAQMEYREGDLERGRTVFEGILSASPKRLDVWLIYLTAEENLSDTSYVRLLYERILTLRLSSKKAKFFFKKFLEFEKTHGDEASIEHVKELAVQYVESK